MDWLAGALILVGVVFVSSSGVGVHFAQSFSQWEAVGNMPTPADQYEARKPGHTANIIKPHKLALTERNTLFTL